MMRTALALSRHCSLLYTAGGSILEGVLSDCSGEGESPCPAIVHRKNDLHRLQESTERLSGQHHFGRSKCLGNILDIHSLRPANLLPISGWSRPRTSSLLRTLLRATECSRKRYFHMSQHHLYHVHQDVRVQPCRARVGCGDSLEPQDIS